MNNLIIFTFLVLILIMISSMMFLIFKKSQHPMILLFLLIIYTFVSTIFVSKNLSSFFLSYLIFMVFIGGVLIMFMYLVSLTNKDKYNIKLNLNKKVLISLTSVSLFMLIFFPLNMISNKFSNNHHIMESSNIKSSYYFSEFILNIDSMYSFLFKLTIISIFLLLYLLISVVKMCSKHSGPIRQLKKMYEKIINKI